jgi:hypothetical protein
LFSESEGEPVTELERWRKIERAELMADRLSDFDPTMAKPAGPEPRETVKDLPTLRISVVTTLGFNQDPRIRLELAVTCVRHPVSVELALGQP